MAETGEEELELVANCYHEETNTLRALCMRCRKKGAVIHKATIVMMSNGRPRLAGECNEPCGRRSPDEGVGVSRMLPPFPVTILPKERLQEQV